MCARKQTKPINVTEERIKERDTTPVHDFWKLNDARRKRDEVGKGDFSFFKLLFHTDTIIKSTSTTRRLFYSRRDALSFPYKTKRRREEEVADH